MKRKARDYGPVQAALETLGREALGILENELQRILRAQLKSGLKVEKVSAPNLDPYKVLGVDRTASPEVIRSAYYTKAKLLHPDTGVGDEGLWLALQWAYLEVMGNGK